MEEDGKLIDKYICPNCEENGKGVTTWKPMCRREGCRKAARVTGTTPSKYCSDECGVLFFKVLLALAEKEDKPRGSKRKLDSDTPITQLNRGGPLPPGILKSLIQTINTAAEFRALGEDILSKIPVDILGSINNVSLNPPSSDAAPQILTESERDELHRIATKKDDLRALRSAGKERERFIAMVKEQHSAYAEREGIKVKDLCGFDSRLSWSTEAFRRWRNGPIGTAAFERGKLALPEPPAPVMNGTNGVVDEEKKADGDVAMPDAPATEAKVEESTLCTKKRCERHKQWAKLMVEDVRCEEASLADQMRAADQRERQIKETALLRWREEKAFGDGETVEIGPS
jgi:COMPASS component SPP1